MRLRAKVWLVVLRAPSNEGRMAPRARGAIEGLVADAVTTSSLGQKAPGLYQFRARCQSTALRGTQPRALRGRVGFPLSSQPGCSGLVEILQRGRSNGFCLSVRKGQSSAAPAAFTIVSGLGM